MVDSHRSSLEPDVGSTACSGGDQSGRRRMVLDTLARETFDVCIVGAGIHGACAAWDAVSRGLTTALIDRDDFGAATSANSMKIVHGGLRYLRSGNLSRMRESIVERSALLRIAPLWVRPQAFLVQQGDSLLDGPMALGAALRVSDLLGMDRNKGLSLESEIRAGRIIDRDEATLLAPELIRGSDRGAAIWYDAVMRDSERLVLSFILSAIEAGAIAANHVTAVSISGLGSGLPRINVEERETGDRFSIRTRCVVDASGPWAGTIGIEGEEDRGHIRKKSRAGSAMVALNVLLSDSDSRAGYGLPIPSSYPDDPLGGSRYLFLVPWEGHQLVGTWYRQAIDGDISAEPERIAKDIESMMKLVEASVGSSAADRSRLRFFHRGILPAGLNRIGQLELSPRSEVVERSLGDKGAAIISIRGVKYTTARRTAERAVDAVFRSLNRRSPPCRTSETPLVGAAAECENSKGQTNGQLLGPEIRDRLISRYGSRWEFVLDSGGGVTEAVPLSPDCAVLRAEVRVAVRSERAMTLQDIVLRRTGLGATGRPDKTTLDRCAKVAGQELQWTATRLEDEIRRVNSVYAPVDLVRSGFLDQA